MSIQAVRLAARLKLWRRAHPLRAHMSVILVIKLAALIAIYHFFFAAAPRAVDRDTVVRQLLQPAALQTRAQ